MGKRQKLVIIFTVLLSLLLVGYRVPLRIQNSPLPVMKVFPEMEMDLGQEITCSNISSRMERQYEFWKEMYENYSLVVSDYSHVTGVWHSLLVKYEGINAFIEDGYFLPIHGSNISMQGSLENWDFVTEEIRNDYIRLLEVLPECLLEDDQQDMEPGDSRMYGELEKFIDMSYELDSTISSFTAQMNQLVSDWYKKYSTFEGQKTRLKKGEFQDISKASANFKEAALLIEGNKQYLLDSFGGLMRRVQNRLGSQRLVNPNNANPDQS